MNNFKITFIGAGSIGFTRRLLADILSFEQFKDIQVAFMDINEKNLDMVTQLCQRDIDENKYNIKIQATTNRREALKDAKYIVNAVRIGGLEAFETDIEIPLKYGVDQCVGDTLCAGGIMYGQRGIAAILDICKDIREVSKPDCLMLSYVNPNAMITWAANKYGKVNTIGLCHGVQHGHTQLATVLGVPQEEVDIICAGINHQTWYTSVKHKGENMLPKLLEGFKNNETLSKEEKCRIDMLERFGFYSTESNGHLSEYLPWYRKRPEEITKWIDLSLWIHGETGGYLRVCKEGRNWFEVDFPNWMKDDPFEYSMEKLSVEHCAHIIAGLELGIMYRGHFNLMNNGCITNLPEECVIEVPCYVDANGISVPRIGDIPLGCAAICSASVWVQRLSVEAAYSGDVNLLKQAFMMDPLTGAVCTPPEIWQMVDEMLIAGEEWLPQYKEEIVKAKDRIAKAKADGTYIPVNENYEGAARLKEKTIEEMEQNAEEARFNAKEAHKAKS